MTDRELLEAAAKAAGMSGCAVDYDDRLAFLEDGKPASVEWNPLTDDGDALRLAVKLQLNELWFDRSTGRPEVVCGKPGFGAIAVEPIREDPYAATRRAIVRAAASLPDTDGGKR